MPLLFCLSVGKWWCCYLPTLPMLVDPDASLYTYHSQNREHSVVRDVSQQFPKPIQTAVSTKQKAYLMRGASHAILCLSCWLPQIYRKTTTSINETVVLWAMYFAISVRSLQCICLTALIYSVHLLFTPRDCHHCIQFLEKVNVHGKIIRIQHTGYHYYFLMLMPSETPMINVLNFRQYHVCVIIYILSFEIHLLLCAAEHACISVHSVLLIASPHGSIQRQQQQQPVDSLSLWIAGDQRVTAMVTLSIHASFLGFIANFSGGTQWFTECTS